uniref:Variant surface glycoprotein 1125.2943 n=1 Tax=Trypanosoma brucei TaxID=5691 RepID=A0A1J0R929_9TRYP|nr:variant surface glycoprotein 1125.2943 [Trypanosoma brucei]
MRTLKITNQADIKPPKITVTADSTNPSSSTLKASTGGRFCIDTRDSGGNTADLSTKSIAARDLAMESKPVPQEINIPDADGAPGGEPEPQLKANHVRLLTTDSMLAKTFKAEQTTRAPITKLISEETSDILSSNRGCQPAAAAALEVKLLDSKNKTEINKMALKYLGDEGKNIGEQFFTKLKNDKITIPTTADPITGTTEELPNSERFQEVLAFFSAKSKMDQGGKTTEAASEGSKESKKSEQEDKKDGDNKTNAADCTGTEEGKCDKNKCTCDKEKSK